MSAGGPSSDRPHVLTLSPIVSATVIALGHTTTGLRLTLLATIVGCPRSSMQRALDSLVSSGLVMSVRPPPVYYRLTPHAACDAVLEAALLLSDPVRATSILLRSSPAIGYAAKHRRGFVALLASDADPVAIDRLDRSLALLAKARTRAPRVRIVELNELARLRPIPSTRRAGSDPLVSCLGQPAHGGRSQLASGGQSVRTVGPRASLLPAAAQSTQESREDGRADASPRRRGRHREPGRA